MKTTIKLQASLREEVLFNNFRNSKRINWSQHRRFC